MADSTSLVGATWLPLIAAVWSDVIRPPSWVVFQSSLVATMALVESWISKVGFASASVIPKGRSEGPIARTMIFLVEPSGPWTMNPSINTFSSRPTGRRVETLPTSPGVAVGVAAGVAVAVGLAVGVGDGVGVGTGGGPAPNSNAPISLTPTRRYSR